MAAVGARKAKGAYVRLETQMRNQGWRIRATRLLLHDVYVRSVALFGAPLWGAAAPMEFSRRTSPAVHSLETMYRG